MRKDTLRIGIDISSLLNHGPDIGAGRYIFNLIKNLVSIDKKNTYILTGRCISSDCFDMVNKLKKESAGRRVELKIFNTTQKKFDLQNRFGR